MNLIEVIALYVKDYLSDREFEEWVYENDEELNKLFCDTIYYEMISNCYNDKNEVIALKDKLKKYLLSNNYDDYNKINDSYVEAVTDTVKTDDRIINILKKPYIQKDKVEINCNNINSLIQLHRALKEELGISQYYGMNWDALKDFLECTLMPQILLFSGWDHLKEIMPDESIKLQEILPESISDNCKVIYIN